MVFGRFGKVPANALPDCRPALNAYIGGRPRRGTETKTTDIGAFVPENSKKSFIGKHLKNRAERAGAAPGELLRLPVAIDRGVGAVWIGHRRI